MTTRKEKRNAANAAMENHPMLVEARERAAKRKPTKRKGGFGGGSGGEGNKRFHRCMTVNGEGYIVGKVVGVADGQVLVCVSKDSWVGESPPKGPCRHFVVDVKDITLLDGDALGVPEEPREVALAELPDEDHEVVSSD
jgi:hypothetical protein